MMRPDLTPTSCLPFEPESARSLKWLPWAVRYKLDEAGLRLTLGQWQKLPFLSRAELVRRLPEQDFALEARKAGAKTSDECRLKQRQIDVSAAAVVLDCTSTEALAWLNHASGFSRYAMEKLTSLVQPQYSAQKRL